MMPSVKRAMLACGVALVMGVSGCAAKPARSDLVATLRTHNGLTARQAGCVADGLYDGVPSANPPIRALTTSELRNVAKPDNAGKVDADVVQILRDVVSHCVPPTVGD